MKTEIECEALAKQKLEEYVNACRCNSVQDVANAIRKMIGMSRHALDVVEHGKQTPIQ